MLQGLRWLGSEDGYLLGYGVAELTKKLADPLVTAGMKRRWMAHTPPDWCSAFVRCIAYIELSKQCPPRTRASRHDLRACIDKEVAWLRDHWARSGLLDGMVLAYDEADQANDPECEDAQTHPAYLPFSLAGAKYFVLILAIALIERLGDAPTYEDDCRKWTEVAMPGGEWADTTQTGEEELAQLLARLGLAGQ